MSALTADEGTDAGESAETGESPNCADVSECPLRKPATEPDCDVHSTERGAHSTDVGALYAGSDGSHYTDWQLERRIDRGTWRRCLSQQRPERHLLEDEAGRLMVLERIDLDSAPAWLEIRVDGERAWAVDTRARRPRAVE